MGERVKLKRPLRYGLKVFRTGEIGETATVKHPIMFRGEPIYDHYVQFGSHKPIGVFESEIEFVEEPT